jgi:hypothetical protein
MDDPSRRGQASADRAGNLTTLLRLLTVPELHTLVTLAQAELSARAQAETEEEIRAETVLGAVG